IWDPLTVWRMIELVRAFRPISGDGRELEVHLARLEDLFVTPTPEMKLLSEIENGQTDEPGQSAGQMDLFRPGSETVPGEAESGLGVRAAGRAAGDRKARTGQPARVPEDVDLSDGGDWAGIVRAMMAGTGDPGTSIEDFMRETARRVHDQTGILIPDDDPEAFIKASARAGVLHIDR
ncbi:MAG: hypothetical protein R3344_12725, partial [Acidobacteriota bacterium]|nr:hypothetical protein [Acidobacteriota bacterium]